MEMPSPNMDILFLKIIKGYFLKEIVCAKRGSRKVCQNRSSFDNIFFVFCLFVFKIDEMREDQINHYKGHHWPASKTPFKWRLTSVPMMAEH